MSDGGTYELEPEDPKPGVRRTPEPVRSGPSMPCAECGYDLRGNQAGRCPECGWKVSLSRLRAVKERQERRVHEQSWFAALMVLLAGVAVVGLVYGYDGYTMPTGAPGGGIAGLGGALYFLVLGGVQLAISVIVGGGVYFLLAGWWFGWTQSVPVTMLQVAAAYAGAMGVLAFVSLTGLPALPWFLSCAALIGLLCRLLDIEISEAVMTAVVSWAVKMLAGMLIYNALINA